jgi:hypothetical protein
MDLCTIVQETCSAELSAVGSSDLEPKTGGQKQRLAQKEGRKEKEEEEKKGKEEQEELLKNKLFYLQRCANNPSLEDYYIRTRD